MFHTNLDWRKKVSTGTYLFKQAVRIPLRAIGYATRGERRPLCYGLPKIIGSFPPPDEWSLIGEPANYFIHDGYCHRREPAYCNATKSTDEWQREVYQFAREVFDVKGLSTVCDIGCGSAHKLLKFFANATTVGVDVPETCAALRRRWPGRCWLDSFAVPGRPHGSRHCRGRDRAPAEPRRTAGLSPETRPEVHRAFHTRSQPAAPKHTHGPSAEPGPRPRVELCRVSRVYRFALQDGSPLCYVGRSGYAVRSMPARMIFRASDNMADTWRLRGSG